MSPSPADIDKISQFWEMIAASSDTFVEDMMRLGGQAETTEFIEAATRLRTIHPDLALVLGGSHQSRPEIVISAGGIHHAFPFVQQVADAAPEQVRTRYAVRAFRPRVADPSGLRVRVKGRELGVSDIYWEATANQKDPARCDLVLYVPGYLDALPVGSQANGAVVEPVFLLLDHLVGEWGVEAQIGYMEWRDSHRAPTDADDLSRLPNYLDALSARD